MPQVLGNLDFARKRKIIGALVYPIASDPGTLVAGDESLVWVNTTDHRLKYYDGTTTRSLIRIGADFVNGDIPLAKLATDPLARASHTGTQLASTISDFDTQVRTSRLDQMAVPTASVNLNSRNITNLLDPVAAQDAATRNYVDNTVAGMSWKDSVRAATTVTGTLASAFQNASVIDGVTLATGNRILLKNQTAGAENGIYTVNASGAPTRATDADTGTEIAGAAVYVEEGTTNSGSVFLLVTDPPITINSTSLSFTQFAGGTTYTAGAGLSGTTTFDVGAGTGISVAADTVAVDTAVVARKFVGTVTGNASTTTFTITHNLSNDYPCVEVWDDTIAPKEIVIVNVKRNSINAVDVIFDVAPAGGQNYKVQVIG